MELLGAPVKYGKWPSELLGASCKQVERAQGVVGERPHARCGIQREEHCVCVAGLNR